MSGANAILAEALARVEYKLDLLLNGLGFAGAMQTPMHHFIGAMCPACKNPIDYQVDLANQVVVRKCGCRSGKQPPIVPLIPVAPTENKNGNPPRRDDEAAGRTEGAPGAEERPRR